MLFGCVFSILSRESNEIAEKLIQVSKKKQPALLVQIQLHVMIE